MKQGSEGEIQKAGAKNRLVAGKRGSAGKYWQLYGLMLFPVIYFIIFKYVPMFGNILAFRKHKPGLSPFGTEWTGLRYFEMFLKDPSFWRAFLNTFILAITNLIVNFPIPIVFALLLNELTALRYKKIIQTVTYMPRFVSTVVVISMLTEILSPTSGIVNRLLADLYGMDPIFFANEPRYFRILYILTDTWQFTGWTAVIYLAAITSIEKQLYEAAMIDGANRWQQTRFITLPSILSTIMVMFIMKMGYLLGLGFEKVLLLYTPKNSVVSDIIDTFVYRVGLVQSNYSYSTAVGLFGGVVGLILVVSANKISKSLTGESLY
jgi:putative aldouronate transport system permease protein